MHGCTSPAGVSSLDDSFLFAAASLSRLTLLNLRGCALISDIGLTVISRSFPLLQSLDISRSAILVTDAGVARLGALRQLSNLSLAMCERVTSEGIVALVSDPPGSLARDAIARPLPGSSDMLSAILPPS